MKIDMLSVSGHKIHGPKGIGFLYVGDRVKIRPIVFGGGQERGLRSGTENVPAIAGMGKAAEEMYQNLDTDLDRMYALKQRLADGISTMENVRINGLCGRDSAPHVLSVSFAGVRSEVLLHALEEREIYVSAGSACASNHPDTAGSATLRAIGLPKELLNSTIRFSLSVFTTEEEIDYTVQVLHELVPDAAPVYQKIKDTSAFEAQTTGKAGEQYAAACLRSEDRRQANAVDKERK